MTTARDVLYMPLCSWRCSSATTAVVIVTCVNVKATEPARLALFRFGPSVVQPCRISLQLHDDREIPCLRKLQWTGIPTFNFGGCTTGTLCLCDIASLLGTEQKNEKNQLWPTSPKVLPPPTRPRQSNMALCQRVQDPLQQE